MEKAQKTLNMRMIKTFKIWTMTLGIARSGEDYCHGHWTGVKRRMNEYEDDKNIWDMDITRSGEEDCHGKA